MLVVPIVYDRIIIFLRALSMEPLAIYRFSSQSYLFQAQPTLRVKQEQVISFVISKRLTLGEDFYVVCVSMEKSEMVNLMSVQYGDIYVQYAVMHPGQVEKDRVEMT
jgi:hypothetical protein